MKMMHSNTKKGDLSTFSHLNYVLNKSKPKYLNKIVQFYTKRSQMNSLLLTIMTRSSGVTRALIGGCIFIYSCSARRISFEMNLISKEIRRAEHEYMNIHPPN